MQVTKEQIDPCKIALTISIETDKVKSARDKAFSQCAKGVQIPGFRKGKVPPQIARNHVDEGRVKQLAAEMLVGPAYEQALVEAEVEAFAGLSPDLEMVEFPDDGPLVFKASVPLRPVITIGPYKGLDLEQRRLKVTDEDVDRQIEEMRARHAEYPEITDRPAQMGDVILADLQAAVEGQEMPQMAEPRATVIEIGKNIADFDTGMVGMAIGETKTIDALYPDTFADENLRGKRATFTVTLKELRSRILPELTEEFIAKIRPDAHSEDELRIQVRESLVKAADEMSENDVAFAMVSKIVDNSQVFYPDALLRAEMQADINELTEQMKRENATFEQHLLAVGKTGEQVQSEMAQAAGRRIRNSLVLSEIARTEELTVDESDIEAQINERAERAKVSPAAVRAFLEKNDQINQIRDQALTEKILDFLRDASHITERTVTREELLAFASAAQVLPVTPGEAAPETDDSAATTALGVEDANLKPRRLAKTDGETPVEGDSEPTETAAE